MRVAKTNAGGCRMKNMKSPRLIVALVKTINHTWVLLIRISVVINSCLTGYMAVWLINGCFTVVTTVKPVSVEQLL